MSDRWVRSFQKGNLNSESSIPKSGKNPLNPCLGSKEGTLGFQGTITNWTCVYHQSCNSLLVLSTAQCPPVLKLLLETGALIITKMKFHAIQAGWNFRIKTEMIFKKKKNHSCTPEYMCSDVYTHFTCYLEPTTALNHFSALLVILLTSPIKKHSLLCVLCSEQKCLKEEFTFYRVLLVMQIIGVYLWFCFL